MKERQIKRKSINFDGEKIYLDICRYESNNRLAIIAHTKYEPYGDITKNLPEINLETERLVAIDSLCKSIGLEKKLIDGKIIARVVANIQDNFETYDIVYLNLEKLYEYDPKGFMKELGNNMLVVEDEEMEAE